MATNARPVREFTLKLAAEIRAQRSGKKLKQDDFSKRAEIPVSTLSQIENGRMAIDAEQIYRIAIALDTTPDDLIAEAIRNAPGRHIAQSSPEVGPLVTSTGSVMGSLDEDEHKEVVDWARSRAKQARESRTPSPEGSASTKDQ